MSHQLEFGAQSLRVEKQTPSVGAALNWAQRMPRRSTAAVRASFSIVAGLIDLLTILGVATAVEWLYHYFAYSPETAWLALSGPNLQLCVFVAASFVVANAARKEYSFANYLQLSGHGARSFKLWSIVVLCALGAGFLAKTVEESSRVAFVLVYVFGFLAIYAERVILAHFVGASAASGGVSARRLFLVGAEKDVEHFNRRYKPWTCGMNVVGAIALRESGETIQEDVALAAASARMLLPDDIFILAPWSRTDIIDACVSAFLRVPARIHLGPDRVLDRFSDAHIDKVGAIASLSLSGQSVNLMEAAGKRLFDIVVASLALIILSPLLLLCAALIRLDSPGPALFFQRRYGFNREMFRIAKFRSMTTMDDGRAIRQATSTDMRVTRIGKFLRRYNIDELPQLLNVLKGEMSLVGPRPHAVAHDQLFERRVALYARRHNVKPGITGWAQVNGLRGEIDSPEKIRARIEYDLYYIDNWSLILDIWIILRTVFSRKAYQNAV